MVQVCSGKSLTLRKFRTHIKAKPVNNLCAPLVLFLLFANVLAQTPIEFEHFRIYFDSRFKLCHAETFLQVRHPLHIVLVCHERIAIHKLRYVVLVCHNFYSFTGSSNSTNSDSAMSHFSNKKRKQRSLLLLSIEVHKYFCGAIIVQYLVSACLADQKKPSAS